MRVITNEHAEEIDRRLITEFGWPFNEQISWLSPVESDGYAEYYDEAFLERLGVSNLKVPLRDFWPQSGPRWDGLARTDSGRLILVEAKAYIEEGVDYRSKAGPGSMVKIQAALAKAKKGFRCTEDAPWESPFYQYANRLAHLFFLYELNNLDAYLVFLYFADAPDVPSCCSREQWEGAIRLTEKCMGLPAKHPYRDRVRTIIMDCPT